MEPKITPHDEVTFNLDELPRPASDPNVTAIAARLDAAERAARGVAAELAAARDLEAAAGRAYGEALGGTTTAVTRAAATLDDAAAGVVRIRSRLLVAGRAVEELRAEHLAALASARSVALGEDWRAVRTALEAAVKELSEATHRVEGQLAALEQRAVAIQSRPLRPMTLITFTRPWLGRGSAGYQAGDTAGVDPVEAAEVVRRGAAIYVDPWESEAMRDRAPLPKSATA